MSTPRSSPACSAPDLTTSQNESPGAAWVTTSMRRSLTSTSAEPLPVSSSLPPPLSSPVLQPVSTSALTAAAASTALLMDMWSPFRTAAIR